MNRETFNKLLEDQFDHIRQLSNSKGEEYAGSDDVLADFREVGKALGISPEVALLCYQSKHWRAINSYVQTGEVRSEPIEGRLQDLILYSLLLIAMDRDKQPLQVPAPFRTEGS